jgi:hypothetical protein
LVSVLSNPLTFPSRTEADLWEPSEQRRNASASAALPGKNRSSTSANFFFGDSIEACSAAIAPAL